MASPSGQQVLNAQVCQVCQQSLSTLKIELSYSHSIQYSNKFVKFNDAAHQALFDRATHRTPDDIRGAVELERRQISKGEDGAAIGPAAPVHGGEARFTNSTKLPLYSTKLLHHHCTLN